MQDKKKQKWQENREMIQADFKDLDERYEALKELVAKLTELSTETANDILRSPGVGIRRPGKLRNIIRDVKELAALPD